MATLLTMLVTSVADSHSGLPVSSPIARASSSACALRATEKRSSTAMRPSREHEAQPGNAARAATTAASTWAAEAAWPRQTTAWLTGFNDSRASP